jgi:HPt (histidine-containing phosphotransfer) domain-containing protein
MSSSSDAGDDALAPRAQNTLHADMNASPSDDELNITQQMFGDGFSELARLFLDDSPPRLAALDCAAQAADCTQLAQIVHTLCGSTSSIGATKLAALCTELETLARDNTAVDVNQAHQANDLVQAIKTEYARIEKKLHAML